MKARCISTPCSGTSRGASSASPRTPPHRPPRAPGWPVQATRRGDGNRQEPRDGSQRTAEPSDEPPLPTLLARITYTPTGEAHLETGPELLRLTFDAALTRVGTQEQEIPPPPIPGDPPPTVPGGLRIATSLPIAPATFEAGVSIEHWNPETRLWETATRSDFALGPAPPTEDEAELDVMRLEGWRKGELYRITITPELEDAFARALQLPAGTPAEGLATDLNIPTDGTGPTVEKSWPIAYDTVQAASATLGGKTPGGLGPLWDGMWADPQTGLHFARNRWLDTRSGTWLSEDPLRDGLNAYAGMSWRGHMEVDPLGLISDEMMGEYQYARSRSFAPPSYSPEIDAVLGGATEAALGMVINGGRGSEYGPIGQALYQGIEIGLHTRERIDQAKACGGSAWEGTAVSLGDLTGFTGIMEGGQGWEAYGDQLDPIERYRRIGQGSFGLAMTALTVAGGVSTVRTIASSWQAPVLGSPRATPAQYGLRTIAEDQSILDIYNDTLRWAAKGENAYTKHLKSPTLKSANRAWQETVSPQFLKRMRNAGYDISEVHHWNWPRSMFPEHVFDARHLVPIPQPARLALGNSPGSDVSPQSQPERDSTLGCGGKSDPA